MIKYEGHVASRSVLYRFRALEVTSPVTQPFKQTVILRLNLKMLNFKFQSLQNRAMKPSANVLFELSMGGKKDGGSCLLS